MNSKPELFTELILPDNTGAKIIRSCVTYNPPGPTKAGISHSVTSILQLNFILIDFVRFPAGLELVYRKHREVADTIILHSAILSDMAAR